MNRRTAVKSLTAISAGMILFPGCSDGLKMNALAIPRLVLNADQKIWIEAISNAILPKENLALTTYESFPEFVSKMVTFQKSDKDQISFVNGYNTCTNDIKKVFKMAASKVQPDQIISYFSGILENKEEKSGLDEEATKIKEDKYYFCTELRRLSIKHLTTSEEYQKEVLNYKLVPDPYKACVAI